MFVKTLTDLYIEQGIIKPLPSCYVLDSDGAETFILDGEENPKKEEKDRE